MNEEEWHRKQIEEHGCEGCGGKDVAIECPVCNDTAKKVEDYSAFPGSGRKVPGSKATYDGVIEGHYCSSCGYYDGYK